MVGFAAGSYAGVVCISFFSYGYGDHRDLHGLTRSFPTRRSSDLVVADGGGGYSAAGHCIAAAHRFGHAAGRREDIAQIGRAHAELQSLMRISYAVFCSKKKKQAGVRDKQTSLVSYYRAMGKS